MKGMRRLVFRRSPWTMWCALIFTSTIVVGIQGCSMAGGCRRFLTRSTCSLRPNTNTCEVPGKEGVNTGGYEDIVLPVIESGQA